MHTVIWIVAGAVAGALARLVTRTRWRGYLGDTVLGWLGSISGAWLLRLLYGRDPGGTIGHIATAFGGAVLLITAGRVARWLLPRAPVTGDISPRTVLENIEARIKRLSDLERTALDRVLHGRILHLDSDSRFRQQWSFGERVADRVATFGGSWTFLGCFAAFMLAWMYVNTEREPAPDPFPFILLNLMLSCLAAVQAPIIMMSQNRQAAKDRFEAQQDYQVNVRAEMQIASLHLKLDETRNSDIAKLVELQERQTEALERIAALLDRPERDRS